MRRIFMFILFQCMVQVIISQNYYYYHGHKVYLPVLSDSVVAYVYPQSKSENYIMTDIKAHTIPRTLRNSESINVGKTKMNILSCEYIIGDSVNRIRMSNHFYVKLYKSDDITLLNNIVKKTHTTLLGEIPYMQNWYDLMMNCSMFDNSLDMSNYFFETGLFEDVDPGFVFNFSPNCVSDTHYNYQWALPAINACETWNITKGDNRVKIAIVDMGVEKNHIEFSNTNFVESMDCYANTTYSKVYAGTYLDSLFIPREFYHGINVCGIISADHNHERIAGIAPESSIIVISHPLSGDLITSELAYGISCAVNYGADIINCSWGDQGGVYHDLFYTSSLLENALTDALENGRNGKGCVVVFASGNHAEEGLPIDYPGNFNPKILVVGAVNPSKDRATFSAYGSALDIVAPGEAIYTTEHNSGYVESTSGTSFAAPYVSGIASLMLAVNPELKNTEIADILEMTAQKIDTINYIYTTTSNRPNGKWNNEMGYGLVDAYAAVMEAQKRHIQNKTYENGTSIIEYYPEIFAGYSVTDAVPYGNVVVKSGSNVTYKATGMIHLKPGFHAEAGATFHAYIDSPTASMLAPAHVRRTNKSEDNENEQYNAIDLTNDDTFYISPNPVTNILQITASDNIARITIYNIAGQTMLQKNNVNFVDVSALPSGLYIVQGTISDGKQLQTKFIKQ